MHVVDEQGAQSLDEDDNSECPLCDSEDAYVKYDDDIVCENCGHVRGGEGKPQYNIETEVRPLWHEWFEYRRENDEYSGWYGEDRIRFVGGFEGVWHRDDDV